MPTLEELLSTLDAPQPFTSHAPLTTYAVGYGKVELVNHVAFTTVTLKTLYRHS